MQDADRLVSTENAMIYRDDGLYTICLFDTPVIRDAQLLVSVMRDYLSRGEPAHAIVDLRALRHVDSGPFLHLTEPIIKNRNEIARITKSVAVLHGGGMAAATVSGAMAMYFASEFPIKGFAEIDLGFRWMGLPRQKTLDHEHRVEQFRSTPSLVRRCASFIEDHLIDASLASCAAHLELSDTELQRELSAAETSFRTELRTARIEAAKELLLGSNTTMALIGEKVGYRKQQNFTDAFRKATGMTPAAWRKQQRAR